MIPCRVARRRIDAALERDLSLEQRFELEEHLAGCPACAERERRARGLQELLESGGEPALAAPDVEVAARKVLAALERGEGEVWRPRRARRLVPVAGAVLALAAGLALLALVASWLMPEPTPESRLDLAMPAHGALDPEAGPAGLDARPTEEPGPTSGWDAGSVEAQVRLALLECFPSAGVDEERARQRFLESTREPARAGWPVRRFVEGLLESPDATLALASARCLGALREPAALSALERALARPALTETALEALGAIGEPAVPALERALLAEELGARAVLQLCRIGGPRAAQVLERAARNAGPSHEPSREALLDALSSTGPAAVAGLMRLAQELDEPAHPEIAAGILARLPLVAGAGAELAGLVARERIPADLVQRALIVLRPPEALGWLEARCLSSRERSGALEVLAHYEGQPPLDSTLRLAFSGRVPRADVVRLLSVLLERESERAETFSSELVARAHVAAAREWLSLLIESEHPGAGLGLVPLVLWDALAPEDRQWAALALGELGTEADAERLSRALQGALPDDRRLLAACLLSIHGRLGSAALEPLLAAGSALQRRRVLFALEDSVRAGDAVRVHRVARALDGFLAEIAATPPEAEEVL